MNFSLPQRVAWGQGLGVKDSIFSFTSRGAVRTMKFNLSRRGGWVWGGGAK